MITGPLTFARHYLTTMRAARSAGVVYIDERSIQGSNSEHGMLTAQSQITTGNRGQTVAPRVLMSGPG
ncbi:MAG TPA: hypothetical protein PK765_03135 [bacterium]|nr:hypothetical protein [bacterium]